MTLDPIDLETFDGTHLRGGLLRQQGARRTILYFGGNIATAGRTGLRMARLLSPLGTNVALVDYRGYGVSDLGPASASALLEDGLRIFDHVRSLPGVDSLRIVVHGHSMGSLIAAHVAASRNVEAVVLESSATSTDEYVGNQIPWYAKPFVRVRIAPSLRAHGNLRLMPSIRAPLLLVVGENDSDTPARFSRALLSASSLPDSEKTLAVIPRASHSDSFEQPEALHAYRALLRSLDRRAPVRRKIEQDGLR